MDSGTWETSELLSASSCGGRVSFFRFARPERYTFVPGQYFMLALETEQGRQSKPFTLCQAPADPYLEVTTRMSDSPFKRALAAMGSGGPAEVSSARGKNVLPEGTTRAVFLTGGVGITPARSMLRDAATRDGGGLSAALFYGNLDDLCVPFLDEFERMADDGWCELVLVYERPPEGWAGETGFITADVVRRHVDTTGTFPFVVSGPPAMVEAMERVLDDLAVPAGRRLVERFSGY